MTHPLTDEMMRKIHGNRPGYSNPFDEDDMRAAYSKGSADMLEQVIRYLEQDLEFTLWSNKFMEEFKKAMRPQEEKL